MPSLRHYRAGSASATLAVTLAVSACSEGPVYWALPESERAPLGEAERVTRAVATAISPAFELRVPQDSTHISMGSAVDIGAGEIGDRCMVVVADRVDRAIHLFDERGSYVSTIHGGGRDTSRLPDVREVNISSDQVVAVDGSTRTVWIFDTRGAAKSVRIPSPVRPSPPGFRVAYNGSRLYEVWVAPNGKSSADWDSLGIPPIREFDLDGRAQGGYGALRHFSGLAMPSALNVGMLALRGDTLWFANAAEGRVDGYALQRGSLRVPSRTLPLPLFFRPRAPLELRGPGDADAESLVEYHLHSFSLGPAGEFLTIQATSYPEYSPRLRSYQPEVVVSAAGPDGQLLGVFDLGFRPVALAATAQYWFAIVRDAGRRMTRVFAYANPFTPYGRVAPEVPRCG